MSTRTQYEADLAALKGSLAKMSQLSADAVEDALEALCTADAEEAKGIIKGDTEVNRMERDIEVTPIAICKYEIQPFFIWF